MNRTTGIIFLLPVFFTFSIQAQNNGNMTREDYIAAYREIAVKEMKRTGIPASITLAQGILESGNGNSRLAKKANNHFGIKCHDWTGRTIREDDDKRNECFRRYRNADHSYTDHSDFLTSRSRYSFLFGLEPTDYKGWAKGLKTAGYATSKTYDKALIRIIEEYRLYELDQGIMTAARKERDRKDRIFASESGSSTRKIHYNNRIKFVYAQSGDRLNTITDEFFMMSWQLTKYNEFPRNESLQEGDIVYLQPKRNRAAIGNDRHIVNEGETMHDISQLYGIKLEKLYKKNQMEVGEEPLAGQELSLRRKIKKEDKPLIRISDIKIREVKDHEEEMQFEFDPA